MRLSYYADTDSLYIDLNSRESVESREIGNGIVLDFGADGTIVGIDVDHASEVLNLEEVELHQLPIKTQRIVS